MIEITEIINETVFKNDTFKIFSTETGESTLGIPTYTPNTITTWNSGFFEHGHPRNLGFVAHEMAHVVDVYRRKRSALLQPDFGFVHVRNAQLTAKAALFEAEVIAIQFALRDMDKQRFEVAHAVDFHRSLFGDGIADFASISAVDFCDHINSRYHSMSGEQALNDWHEACKLIKQSLAA